MDRMLKTELQIPSDSMSVLKYIASTTARFKTFVANRVAIIQTLSKVTQWNYVSSKLNPAAVASRGMRTDAFLQSKTWIHGPEFVKTAPCKWPGSDEDPGGISVDDPDARNVVPVYAIVLQPSESPTASLPSHFSSWIYLKRAVGWILKYKELLKQAPYTAGQESALFSA